ncbi:MAG: acyl-CoA dehydrogenase family protein [Candidatus Eremiobacteraeota bacterium]|nr:acyl-CoA dehydrogenase family protein [Candidatus Eremiobacteraeota bacterium]
MDLSFSPEDLRFREEIRAFVAAELPPAIKHKMQAGIELERDDYVAWQKILSARGWLAPNWPVEYGGTDWTIVQKHIFDEELAVGFAPRSLPFGVSMVAPVIINFGSEEQKQRYLPRILSSEDWWCQGYSEPGSGSDLASLSTRAERDGDSYVINGAKTWITLAQYANMIFVLARTDPTAKKQKGISFILVDMTTPGVTVRPIETIDGGHEINEVIFENVRVPLENLVGTEGGGWTYAKFLLEHERNGTAGVAGSFQMLDRLKEIASEQRYNGSTLMQSGDFAKRIAEVEVRLTALSFTQMRALAAESATKSPGLESSYIKITGTEIQQAITELMMEAGGYESFDDRSRTALLYFNFRKTSIYAGSNEIQRNILAKRMLGL